MTMSRHLRLAPLAFVLAAACKGTEPGGGKTLKPANCSAGDQTIASTDLAVGEARVLSGSAVNCIRLPGNSGSQYLAVVGNVGATPDQVQTYKLGDDASAASAALVADRATQPAALLDAVTAEARMDDVHERLMAEARTLDLAGARATLATRAATSSPSLSSGIRGALLIRRWHRRARIAR